MTPPPARIAIIDDSESVLNFLVELVTTMVGEDAALAFDNPLEALTWCRTNEVDLIVVDYMMPQLDGLRFIEAIRAGTDNSDTPIVMVTTTEARDIRYQALQLGATDFLQKPVDPVEFVTRVRNLLTLSQHHRQTRDYAARLAEDVRKATAEIVERELQTILTLSRAAEYRDNETGAHLVRMSNYSRMIATHLGLAPADVDMIFAASPMHDIGKIGIPDHVLLKPGPFTPEERAVMLQHPVIGWKILSNNNSLLLRMAAEIALSHHEKWDGTGYPNQLAGDAIPLAGRIVAVSDVFDALTSCRPYKKAWPLKTAFEYVGDNRGTHFDPVCADAFLACKDEVLGVVRRYGLDEQ
jgi:response regulator RpfG family c-di-GMP phosphodiesterase